MCYYDYDCTADIVWSVVSIILFFLILSIIIRLLVVRRRRVAVVRTTPVVVTTATTTANPAPGVPLAQTTYYATQITPAVVSQTGTNYPVQQSMVQTTPYPVGNQTMPMPQNQGFNQQPPSYDQVQSNANMYTKQPPYNPNFQV